MNTITKEILSYLPAFKDMFKALDANRDKQIDFKFIANSLLMELDREDPSSNDGIINRLAVYQFMKIIINYALDPADEGYHYMMELINVVFKELNLDHEEYIKLTTKGKQLC